MAWPTQTYVVEQEIALPREKVWELLAQTDHLNRVIGLFSVEFSAARTDSGELYREATAKVAGMISVHWKEYPFNWKKNERYSVLREYTAGPLRRFEGGIELSDGSIQLPDGKVGTRVCLFGDFTPANLLGLLALRTIAKGGMDKTMRYLKRYLSLANQGYVHEMPQITSSDQGNVSELDRLLDQLATYSFTPELLQRFRRHLLRSGDEQVMEMRPYDFAEKWGTPREEVVLLFFYATKRGILNLSWNLMCPNCRVSKESYFTLTELNENFHCDLCGIDYQANFDQYIELRFSVHPTVRRGIRDIYCIGGPAITPHIVSQVYLRPGERAVISAPPSEEPLRLRVLRVNHMVELASHTHFIYTEDGWQVGEGAGVARDVFSMHNDSSSGIAVALEEVHWNKLALTAAEATAMQAFRELFSAEVLAPGQQVSIENVTLLFSDLRGSTVLYETVGDAHAYGKVRKHFEFLTHWITANGGALVKTMGDAVMAVFYQPEQAVKAALDIQRNVGQFNASLSEGEEVVIKIGLYQGRAIVVNSNDNLDYFGRTVNIAARVQGTSIGGDVVISRECAERTEVQTVLDAYDVEVSPFTTTLRGIEGEFELARVQLYK